MTKVDEYLREAKAVVKCQLEMVNEFRDGSRELDEEFLEEFTILNEQFLELVAHLNNASWWAKLKP